MLRLAIRFLAGSYHATPWGRHVNEGDIEWPPSPWRLCRALLATGFARLGWTAVPPEGRSLIERLAASPPIYHLPPVSTGHTRHYMPLYKNVTAKVLDAFAFVGRGESAVLGITWEVEPTAVERALFEALAARLSYLGRTESSVAAEVTDILPAALSVCRVSDGAPGPGYDRLSLLAPLDASAYAVFLAQRIGETSVTGEQEDRAHRGEKASRRTSASREATKLAALYPKDIIAALLKDTTELQREAWSQPPGSRWLPYWRERDAYTDTQRTLPRAPRRSMPFADTALLALSADTSKGEVLPRLENGLPSMELLHSALVRHSARQGIGPSPCLSGKDQSALPLKGHRHAWLLPLSIQSQRHIDHVLVYAAMGFDESARDALSSVQVAYGKRAPRMFVTLLGVGRREDFEHPVPYVRSAEVWRSVLPFVPPRHLKPRGSSSLAGQVQAELASRGLPAAERIEVEVERDGYVDVTDFWQLWQQRERRVVQLVTPEEASMLTDTRLAVRWRMFRNTRSLNPEQRPPVRTGLGVRITLAKAVRGPIALGYASHFGLGTMTPEQ
ncbi:type I-U CRISPR-associated protein Csb2 [Sorangium sp. So ce1128]